MNKEHPLIILVEDDQELARLNARMLTRRGYEVRLAFTFAEAEKLIAGVRADLYVLDVTLPDGNGLALCEKFRTFTDAPVIFLTGKTETKDKVLGLGAGGDYYLTKPVDKVEFLAVVESLLRRTKWTNEKINEAAVITRGTLTLKIPESKAFVNGVDAGLTRKEFSLLLLLVQNEDKELTSEQLYEYVWNASMFIDTGIIRKHISQLKRKLQEENTDSFSILNAYGGGYLFTVK